MSDRCLDRFVDAQARVWPAPLEEIRRGRKDSHWMWYVFPQLRGLGRSVTAQYYGIADLDEAMAYLSHDVLGPRLTAVFRAMLAHEGTAPEAVLGPVDAMKLRSCATLFEAAGEGDLCARILAAFHGGARCVETLRMLAEQGAAR